MGLLAGVILIFVITLTLLDSRRMQCFNVKGIICPVFTPVDDNGRLNPDIVHPYAQFLWDKGVDGVVVAGTAGEGLTLNVTDKKNLIDAWVQAAKSLKLSVSIQVGGIPLPDAQELAAYAQEAGADAILIFPEFYYEPRTAKKLVYFVQEVAQAAPETPVLYHHIPENTGVYVDMVEFLQLATQRIPNFKGLKSQDFGTALILNDKLTKDQRIFVADSLYLAPAVFMGFHNFIMSEINLFPKLFKSIVHNGRKHKYRRARYLYRKMRKLRAIITKDNKDNELAALKEALPLVTGVNPGPIRPPEIRLTFEEVVRIEERLKEAKIEIIDSALDDDKIVPLTVDCSSDKK